MNNSQRTKIDSNLSVLVKLTKCNIQFLTIFEQHKILSTDECTKITAQQSAVEQAYQFYSLIQTRTNAYDVLIDALEETLQTGAVNVLQEAIPLGADPTSSPRRSVVNIHDSPSSAFLINSHDSNLDTSYDRSTNSSPVYISCSTPRNVHCHLENVQRWLDRNKIFLHVAALLILLLILVGVVFLVYSQPFKNKTVPSTLLDELHNATTDILVSKGNVKLTSSVSSESKLTVLYPKFNKTFSSTSPESTTASIKNDTTRISTTTEVSKVVKDFQTIIVHTPQKLHTRLFDLCDPRRETTLKIVISDPKEWDNPTIDCSSRVYKLEIHGNPTLFNIHNILNSTRLITELTINASRLYQTSLDLHSLDTLFGRVKVSLNEVQKLSISGNTKHEQSNWEILSLMGRHFRFRKLIDVSIEGVGISVRTKTELSRLVSRNIKSLRNVRLTNLHFIDETLTLNLNSTFLQTFELSIVRESNVALAQESVFPIITTAGNITNFKTNVPMNDHLPILFENFVKKNVKIANFTLNVNPNSSTIDLSFMSKVSEHLRRLEINLIGVDPTLKIPVDGIDKISHHTKYITIESNCIVFARNCRCRNVVMRKFGFYAERPNINCLRGVFVPP